MSREVPWVTKGDLKIVLVDEEHVDGDESYGSCDEKDGTIRVVRTLPDIAKRKALHEIGHRMFLGMPGWTRVDIFGRISEHTFNRRQEAFCVWLEDRPFDLLTRSGLLTFPEPPTAKRARKP